MGRRHGGHGEVDVRSGLGGGEQRGVDMRSGHAGHGGYGGWT